MVVGHPGVQRHTKLHNSYEEFIEEFSQNAHQTEVENLNFLRKLFAMFTVTQVKEWKNILLSLFRINENIFSGNAIFVLPEKSLLEQKEIDLIFWQRKRENDFPVEILKKCSEINKIFNGVRKEADTLQTHISQIINMKSAIDFQDIFDEWKNKKFAINHDRVKLIKKDLAWIKNLQRKINAKLSDKFAQLQQLYKSYAEQELTINREITKRNLFDVIKQEHFTEMLQQLEKKAENLNKFINVLNKPDSKGNYLYAFVENRREIARFFMGVTGDERIRTEGDKRGIGWLW